MLGNRKQSNGKHLPIENLYIKTVEEMFAFWVQGVRSVCQYGQVREIVVAEKKLF